MTTTDDAIEQAGGRLAEMPVEAPELSALVGHRRRRRLLAGGALVAALLVTTGIAGALARSDENRTYTAESAGTVLGPAEDGLFPDVRQRFSSLSDLGTAFSDEYLGWDVEVVTQPPDEPGGPRSVVLRNPSEGQELEAVACSFDGAWRLVQVGDPTRLSAESDGSGTRVSIPSGPAGTASIRWSSPFEGHTYTATEAASARSFVVPVPTDEFSSVVVVYLDDQGVVLDAVGGGR